MQHKPLACFIRYSWFLSSCARSLVAPAQIDLPRHHVRMQTVLPRTLLLERPEQTPFGDIERRGLDAAGRDRSIAVTVQLRVGNVDLNASSKNFEILIAFQIFDVQFSR